MRYLILCLLLTGCTATYTPVEKPSEPAAASPVVGETTRIANWGPYLQTVEHDGHKFIVTYKGDAVSVLHSPACKCQATKGGQHAD